MGKYSTWTYVSAHNSRTDRWKVKLFFKELVTAEMTNLIYEINPHYILMVY